MVVSFIKDESGWMVCWVWLLKWVLICQRQQYKSIMQGETQDEQLLDGVAMTMSISCEGQECEEIPSEASFSNELEITINHTSHQRSRVTHQRNLAVPQRLRLTETVKTKSRGKSEAQSFGQARTSTRRTWQTMLQLDDRLFKTHFLGLLQSTQSMAEKLNQLVVAEEFGRLKAFEKELIEVMKEIEFGLNEYQKQKKSLLGQVELLKADNDHLNATVSDLHTIIEELDQAMANYFGNNQLQKYIKEEAAQPVPFARTFSHSLEEINSIKLTEEAGSITASDFAGLVFDLRRDSEALLTSNYECCIKRNELYHSLPFGPIRSWLDDIINNFQTLNSNNSARQKQFPSVGCSEVKQFKVVEAFLNKFSRSRDNFLSKLSSASDQSLYLWHVLHSSAITFLGILIHEAQSCSLELSFGDHTKLWVKIFLNELEILVEESGLRTSQDIDRHFCRIQRFVSDVNELIAFRMLRNE